MDPPSSSSISQPNPTDLGKNLSIRPHQNIPLHPTEKVSKNQLTVGENPSSLEGKMISASEIDLHKDGSEINKSSALTAKIHQTHDLKNKGLGTNEFLPSEKKKTWLSDDILYPEVDWEGDLSGSTDVLKSMGSEPVDHIAKQPFLCSSLNSPRNLTAIFTHNKRPVVISPSTTVDALKNISEPTKNLPSGSQNVVQMELAEAVGEKTVEDAATAGGPLAFDHLEDGEIPLMDVSPVGGANPSGPGTLVVDGISPSGPAVFSNQAVDVHPPPDMKQPLVPFNREVLEKATIIADSIQKYGAPVVQKPVNAAVLAKPPGNVLSSAADSGQKQPTGPSGNIIPVISDSPTPVFVVKQGAPKGLSFAEAVNGVQPVGTLGTVDFSRDVPTAIFTKEDCEQVSGVYKFSLIGKFSYGKPDNMLIAKFLQNSGFGVCKVQFLNFKHVLISLKNEELCSKLWLKRESNILGFPMRLFKWDPFFDFKQEPAIVPVWMKILALPIQWFDLHSLNTVGSLIGNFVKADKDTLNRNRLNYARICVEVNLKHYITNKVRIICDGVGTELDVEYEKLPLYCHHCHHVGHDIDACYVYNPELRPKTFVNKFKGKEVINKGKEKEEWVVVGKKGETSKNYFSKESESPKNPAVGIDNAKLPVHSAVEFVNLNNNAKNLPLISNVCVDQSVTDVELENLHEKQVDCTGNMFSILQDLEETDDLVNIDFRACNLNVADRVNNDIRACNLIVADNFKPGQKTQSVGKKAAQTVQVVQKDKKEAVQISKVAVAAVKESVQYAPGVDATGSGAGQKGKNAGKQAAKVKQQKNSKNGKGGTTRG